MAKPKKCLKCGLPEGVAGLVGSYGTHCMNQDGEMCRLRQLAAANEARESLRLELAAKEHCRLEENAFLLAERDALQIQLAAANERAEKAEAEIVEWKCSTMLESGGDPEPITPADNERNINALQAIVNRLRRAELSQTAWEADEDVVTLNGKPMGGTVTRNRSPEFGRWWPAVKRELLGEAAEAAKETDDG